jgi:hypothetical protein
MDEGYKFNLKTLILAAKNDDLCILECKDKETGKTVVVVCAVSTEDEGDFFIPLAKMFDGNPYTEVSPPEDTEVRYDH